MSARTFIDTNVLVYAIDEAEPAKRAVAERVLASRDYGELVLSTQVLSEFYVTVTRKLATPVTEADAEQALDSFGSRPIVEVDTALVRSAVQISRSSKISYWDGLVVAAAIRGGCQRLLSEDLNDGQEICSVRVENPFRGTE
jgi:predicted nucleic acid-binding protein